MQRSYKWLFLTVLYLLIILMHHPLRVQALGEEYYNLDVFVLMDSSNSTRHTDPEGLRFQAFEDLAMQLEPDDRIGLFQFGTHARMVFPLTAAGGEESRQQFRQEHIPKDYLVFTNVLDVLVQAFDEMDNTMVSDHLPFFILFTDGHIYPSNDYTKDMDYRNQYLGELQDIVEQYAAREWPVYIINLNINRDAADPETKAIGERTGGYLVDVDRADALSLTFQEVLDSIRVRRMEIEQNQQPQGIVELRILEPQPGAYTLSDVMGIKGQLIVDGKLEGVDTDLQVNEIYAVINHTGLPPYRIELEKDGEGYSGLHKLLQEGDFSLTIHASGFFDGRPYLVSRNVESLSVGAAGRIMVDMQQEPMVLQPGKKNRIQVTAVVHTARWEPIAIELKRPEGMEIYPAAHQLSKGENTITFWLDIPKEGPMAEEGELLLEMNPVHRDTLLISGEVVIPYLLSKSDRRVPFLLIIGVCCGIVLLYLMIRVLYKKILAKGPYVEGTLSYWMTGNETVKEQIGLKQFKRSSVRFCTDTQIPDTKRIPSIEDDIDIRIYAERGRQGIRYYVTGGIDNILYTGETPHKTLTLTHGLSFQIKSTCFYYENPRMGLSGRVGINILRKYE